MSQGFVRKARTDDQREGQHSRRLYGILKSLAPAVEESIK